MAAATMAVGQTMPGQTDIFAVIADVEAERAERERAVARGMTGSQMAAGFKWTAEQRQAVRDAVELVCRRLPDFTADDVWSELAGSVPVTKGLASVLHACARANLCHATDRTRVSARGGKHDHGQRLTVWASHVAAGPAAA